MSAQIEYDPEVDAMYIRLRRAKVTSTRSLDDSRNVDYDANGAPIGVELLGVSRGVDTSDLPKRVEIEQALAKLGVRTAA